MFYALNYDVTPGLRNYPDASCCSFLCMWLSGGFRGKCVAFAIISEMRVHASALGERFIYCKLHRCKNMLGFCAVGMQCNSHVGTDGEFGVWFSVCVCVYVEDNGDHRRLID